MRDNSHVSFHLMLTESQRDNLLPETNVQKGKQPDQGPRAGQWETET